MTSKTYFHYGQATDHRKSGIATLLIAAVFGAIFVAVFSSASFGAGIFTDIENYIDSAESAADNLGFLSESGIASLLLHEPLWRLILLGISLFFENPNDGFHLISFFCIAVYSAFIYRATSRSLGLLFLLNPLVIDLVMSQVRSATALALILLSLMAGRATVRVFVLVSAFLIHTSVLVLVGIYVLARLCADSRIKKSVFIRVLTIIIISAGIAGVLSFGREALLGVFGDRRAVYDVEPSSIFYVIYWMLFGLFMVGISRPKISDKGSWMIFFSAIAFGLAFFMTVFSTNGTRFIALAIPFAVASIYKMSRSFKYLLICNLALYQGIQFVYWL